MAGVALSVRVAAVPVQSSTKLSGVSFLANEAESWKYVPDSCLKFIEVVRVVVGLVPAALHPIGLDLILAMAVAQLIPYVEWRSADGQGAVAQLGERLICIQEVAGSIPTSSTSCCDSQSRACSSGG